MIVGTSALIAILRAEPDALRFARAIQDADSYALAKEMGEPLLFKGKDFAHRY